MKFRVKFLTVWLIIVLPVYAEDQRATPNFDSKIDADALKDGILGRIKVTGEIPRLPALVINPARFPNAKIPDESLIVSQQGGLKNAFVFLKSVPEQLKFRNEERHAQLISTGGQFVPHALIVQPGQKFELNNLDPAACNFQFTGFQDRQNLTLAPRTQVEVRMTQHEERFPFAVSDDFHPWKKAYILPLHHPFAAVTDSNGDFLIQGLPEGGFKFRIWHERVGFLEKSLTINVLSEQVTKLQLSYPVDCFFMK